MGDEREGRWSSSSSKECRADERRRRSSSREDFVSSSTSRNDALEVDKSCRKVYISWDRFVPKSFLHVHFSRFGSVEYIWMDGRGDFFGFVSFVREEVGRSLVGACHNVEGVKIVIKRAKPDWRIQGREERRTKTCSFFREGRCLRHGHCRFSHSVGSRRSQSRSRERVRKRERLRDDLEDEELMTRRDRDASRKLKEQKKEGRKGSSERDGRLRPPPSVQEKVKVRETLPLPVSARCAEARKTELKLVNEGHVEERLSIGTKGERRVNESKIASSGDDMDREAMKKRIKQLEQALKEKEEAEERKKKFLKMGKLEKTLKLEKKKSAVQRSRG